MKMGGKQRSFVVLPLGGSDSDHQTGQSRDYKPKQRAILSFLSLLGRSKPSFYFAVIAACFAKAMA